MDTTAARRRTPGDAFIAAGASGARTTHPLATVPLTQLFYLLGLVPAVFLIGPALERLSAGNEVLAGTVGVLAVPLNYAFPYVVLWLWLRHYERRSFFASTGFGFDRRTLPGLGWGTLLAVGYILAWIGVSLAAGTARFDRALDFEAGGGAAGVLLIGTLVLVMRVVMVGIEEQLFRGWMLQAVGARWGRTAAVLLSSACFALFHFFFIGNLVLPGATPHEPHWVLMLNIFLWSVFAALVTLRTGSLWAATAFHAAVLILPGFLLTVALPEAGDRGWPAAGDAFGLLIVTVTDPSHYTGGAGFAGLFEGLPATAVLTVLAAAAWLRLRRAERAAP
ncbi:CPBP family intramembrane glutamic endopeptidase [Nocardiopsis potens]|uniref:CPBP family intramembrane glutamic endopeptidase n=1 Tax=Nocardiopsis potens TaxID=1246458 RepID=UPI000347C998|nr:CPBP family intramembrane glutamic endopeptidase [Nocardiopsis potens]